LGSDPSDPQFWQKLKIARGQGNTAADTFDALILAYQQSPEWLRLCPRTRKDYSAYLDKLSVSAGDKLVCDLSRLDCYQLRDAMAATPVAANHMLSVLRTLIEWGIPRGYRPDNPVIGIKKLDRRRRRDTLARRGLQLRAGKRTA
jgi:hypothetical protein